MGGVRVSPRSSRSDRHRLRQVEMDIGLLQYNICMVSVLSAKIVAPNSDVGDFFRMTVGSMRKGCPLSPVLKDNAESFDTTEFIGERLLCG